MTQILLGENAQALNSEYYIVNYLVHEYYIVNHFVLIILLGYVYNCYEVVLAV